MNRTLLHLLFFGAGAATTGIFAQTVEVTSTGVGIGTASPYGKFEVVGDYTDFSAGAAGTQAIAYVTSKSAGAQDAGATLVLRGRTGNGADYYSFAGFKGAKQTAAGDGDYKGYLGIYTQASNGAFYEHMRVDGNGNVGINTGNPVYPLDINGSGARIINANGNAAQLDLVETSGGHDWALVSWGSGAGGGTLSNKFSVYDNTSGGHRLTVDGSGNVGIGTTAPSYKLHVSGPVRATQFIADVNTYSDFVFRPGYKLAPLSEVEATIKVQGHLSDIPSEAEAKRDGLDVAKMQAKLLQKVEELTLYLVAHEKTLSAQQEALSAQQQELRRLTEENVKLRRRISNLSQR